MTALPEGEFLLPLFPLPNLVFFPHTRMPLHVFEPRYRQLVADALERENRLGIVLLRPGWQADYFGAPPVHEWATMTLIETAVPLDDGRYNLLVHGEARVRILGEVSRVPYRVARVVVDPEKAPAVQEAWAQREWLVDLARQYLRYLPNETAVPELETVALDALTNALIMSLNFDTEEKQRLLEVGDLLRRSEEVGNELKNRIETLRFLAPYRRPGNPSQN